MSDRPSPVMVTAVAAGTDRRRLKILLAVVVALVVLLLVVPKVLGGGGGSAGDEVGDQIDFGVAAPGAQPAGPSQSSPSAGEPGAVGSLSDRDPFVPLIKPAAAPAEDPAMASGSTSGEAVPVPPDGGIVVEEGSGTTGDEPVWLPPEPPAPDPAPDEPAAPPAQEPASHRFAVLEVQRALDGRPTARVRVDDAVMDVTPVQDFADSFRVLSVDVDTRCGQFMYGDVTFVLCEGQEITT